MTKHSFIIITTYGPDADKPNSVRGKLHQLYLKGLAHINYDNFKVFLFGHKASSRLDNIFYVKANGFTKEQKLREAKQYLLEKSVKADYILRLDDDDILNPEAFNMVNQNPCDVYVDKFHTFYDITSGKTAQQQRPWFPNTTILRYELSFHYLFLDNALFFNYQHSYWHYYIHDCNLKLRYAEKNNPLYLRILNKSSITSGQQADGEYQNYLKPFGAWKMISFQAFASILNFDKNPFNGE